MRISDWSSDVCSSDLGLVANFDWRPTDTVRTYIRTLYSKFSDREDRFGFSVEPDDDTIVDQAATTGRFGDAEAARDLKFRREDTSSFSATVGRSEEHHV